MKEIESIYNNRNSVNFSLCKEVFEKFGERPAKIMRERLNRDHELNMNLMMKLFEQLYDQFLEFCR